MRIFLPWNLPEYHASNGFHDLYDFLLEENDYCDFRAIKTEIFYNSKILRYFSAIFGKIDLGFRRYRESASPSYLLNKIGSASCSLKFLHTSPIFAGNNKPFVFHLEDFQSIFLHRDILPVFKKDVDLQAIFESSNCLAIMSHIPETLQSFRNYFNSPIINSKLQYNKIAISSNFIKSIENLKVSPKRDDSETVFLFTSSGHQNTNNYVTRGFKVVVNLAKKLIEENYKVKFIFKCAKLSRPDLLYLGLSEEQVDFIHNCESIIWYEEYLSDAEMSALYKMSDFFLLPSAQLHSMSILKSMYCESIPVVTDTIGTDQYVDHLKSGIVLNGVKKAVFQDKKSLLKANIENYLALEGYLTEQIFSNLVKIIDEKDAVKKMRNKAKESVIKHYSPTDNADHILRHILTNYQKKISRRKRKISRILKVVLDRYLTSDFSRYKQILSQKVFEWEKISVFKYHSYFYINKKYSPPLFNDLTKFLKPYKDMYSVNKALKSRLFK